MTRRASVIMPVRNGATTIGEQLWALSGQAYDGPWEIVVVDNGSTDETVDVIADWQRRLRHLRLHIEPRAASSSLARNAGCQASDGDLLLFCDHDDVVASGWVAAMARGLDEHPAVGGFVERKLLNDEAALAARRERPGLLESFGFLPYPLTANCGVRRAVWSELGGFNPSYTHGSSDVEFFWRAQLAGHPLGYAPDAVVHYRLRHRLRDMAAQYYSYGRSHPQLYREFARSGMPPSRPAAAASAWWRLTLRTPELLGSRPDRAVWLTQAAMRAGRVLGSARHRVLYL